MESVYSKSYSPFGKNSESIWENVIKWEENVKEVRTACCKQRAPDVKDIQISAQNTLPQSFHITGDTRVWKKKHQKQNSCNTAIVPYYEMCIFSH